jgi:hypothetical protein
MKPLFNTLCFHLHLVFCLHIVLVIMLQSVLLLVLACNAVAKSSLSDDDRKNPAHPGLMHATAQNIRVPDSTNENNSWNSAGSVPSPAIFVPKTQMPPSTETESHSNPDIFAQNTQTVNVGAAPSEGLSNPCQSTATMCGITADAAAIGAYADAAAPAPTNSVRYEGLWIFLLLLVLRLLVK